MAHDGQVAEDQQVAQPEVQFLFHNEICYAEVRTNVRTRSGLGCGKAYKPTRNREYAYTYEPS